MSKRKEAPNYNRVKFQLFERNGKILISLQMLLDVPEDSKTIREQVLEYYVASDPKNIAAIMNTLIDTAKNFSFVDGNLQATYRKKDIFIIQDYDHIKYHPELQKFVRKFQKKIDRVHKKSGIKNLHVSENRRKFLTVRSIAGIAVTVSGIAIGGLLHTFGSSKLNFQNLKWPKNNEDVKLENENFSMDGIDRLLYSGMEELKVTEPDLAVVSLDSDLVKEIGKDELSSIIQVEENDILEDSLEFMDLEDTSVDVSGTGVVSEKSQSLPTRNRNFESVDGAQDLSMKKDVVEPEQQVAVSLVDDSAVVGDSGQAVRMDAGEIVPVLNAEGTAVNYIVTYNLTSSQIDTIKATVQHEAGFVDPNEVYAVMSTVINRCESGGWKGGSNPYNVIIASGQFQSYYDGHWKQYANGNYAEYTDQLVDQMLSGELLPFHEYERFASGPNATGIQFTKHGNLYR